MSGGPIHHIGGSLIRTKEQNLGFTVKVNDGTLDSRSLSRKEKIKDGIDVVLKASSRIGTKRGKDGSLGSSFGDVFVLEVLGGSKAIVFKQSSSSVTAVLIQS